MRTQAVFLDRDGVINETFVRQGKPYAPATLEEFNLLPRVETALARLQVAGYRLIVVTNQPDVVRGSVSRDEVEMIHSRLRQLLTIDDIRVCYHDDADGCACRKPAPGMLFAAAVEHDITLAASYMVGDRWRDVGAGQRAGCTTILVQSNRDEPTTIEPNVRMGGLGEAAPWILEHARRAR